MRALTPTFSLLMRLIIVASLFSNAKPRATAEGKKSEIKPWEKNGRTLGAYNSAIFWEAARENVARKTS